MNLASVITFNPDINLLMENINAISPQVDRILIIDNNSYNKEQFIYLINNTINNVDFILNSENLGVAKALNQALYYAKKNNFIWLLTLDQDSVCADNLVLKYTKFLEKNKNSDILLLCPQIKDVNIRSIKVEEHISSVQEVKEAITSGSFLNVNNSLSIGGFLDDLFIDYVDFEFCLRGRKKQLKLIRLNSAILFHRLGDIEEKKFLALNFIVTNHSPKRRYFLYRNKIFIYRKYWKDFLPWVIRNALSSLKTIFVILCYENNKSENLKNIFRGIIDGFRLKLNIK